jgi:hypothetical protein
MLGMDMAKLMLQRLTYDAGLVGDITCTIEKAWHPTLRRSCRHTYTIRRMKCFHLQQ